MISRRLFTAACLASPFCGCHKSTQSSSPLWNEVVGFAAVNDRRVKLVDGFLDFDYEPMEWKAYSFRINFWHDLLTLSERSVVHDGFWVDPNHKTVPAGFSMAPSVTVSLGRWRFGERPKFTARTKSTIRFRGFTGDGTSTIGHSIPVTRQEIELAERDRRFAIKWSSAGEHQYESFKFTWDLSFSGLCYDDDWMLAPDAANRDY